MYLKELGKYKKESDFIFALTSFLDEFNLSKNKTNLIKEEPNSYEFDERELCILAAVTHSVCNKHGLNPPSWVFKDKYTYEKPYFAFETTNKEYQEYLKKSTPNEFSMRNLYVGENAISRI